MENSIIVVRMAVPAASPAPASPAPGRPRDHGFHRLRVARVVHETADAASFVLDVPQELRDAFTYTAGQFCTFRATVSGSQYLRCYSMSSTPGVDDELQVTVKRVAGGVVSNWMIDALRPGDVIEVTCPAGVFCLRPDRDLAAFAGGSGITPVFSLLKAALVTTPRRAHLLYANRDGASVIFRGALDGLATRYATRLRVGHHFDAEAGFVSVDEVRAVLAGTEDAECYLCGPQPFMDLVEEVLLNEGVPPERVHMERFTPPDDAPVPGAAGAAPLPGAPLVPGAAQGTEVTIELDGRTGTVSHRAGT
ncbi:MAG TPA: FAD-binding oxidoreductase, partial [Acidimicrobiales bacterium]|nr:FAD-binding oxidoreductase [Acidimicrobiales bacterium]